MPFVETRAAGLEAVALATELLQRARLADRDAGLWEAADIQWWWRRPRRSDSIEQVFWRDKLGPIAAVILTDWGSTWACDLHRVPLRAAPGLPQLMDRANQQMASIEIVDISVRDDDDELRALAQAAGFTATDERSGIMWMEAHERRGARDLPPGYAIVDRRRPRGSHPMIRRNGERVEERLRQCSLYDPSLDLAITAGDAVAGYALFWFESHTGVGLVEPMRIEDAFQRRGLGRALLAAGLDRLADRGARRLKVGYTTDAARALYRGAGFTLTATATTYRRGRAFA